MMISDELQERTSLISLKPGAGRSPDRAVPLGSGQPLTMPPVRNLAEALFHHASVRPAQPALYLLDDEDRLTVLTFGGLQDRARRYASALSRRGVQRGDRVLLAFDTCPRVLELFFACHVLGAVPCLVELPPTNLGPKAWRGRLQQKMEGWGRKLQLKLQRLEARGLVIDDASLAVASHFLPEALEGHPFLASASALEGEEPIEVGHQVSPEELAFIQFTSGTTELPRGVEITHRALMANIESMGQRSEWNTEDLMVGWLPLFHDMGLIAIFLAAFVHGMPCVLMTPMSFLLRPARWLWALHYFRGTCSFAPNFAYQLCAHRIRDDELRGLDLSEWSRAGNAAEFIQADTLRQFIERFAPQGFRPEAMAPAYGMAEVVVGLSAKALGAPLILDTLSQRRLALEGEAVPVPADSPDAMTLVSVGRLLPGYMARIVDDQGQPVGERRQGHIVLKGPSLFRGYYNDPEATAAVLRDGWLWTGDLGYFVGENLFICGRSKDLIIKAGENHHPYALERAAARIQGIRGGVAAVGVINPHSGTEDVVIVCETSETDPAALHELRARIEEQVFLETGLRPDRVLPVAPRSIPRTSSGKIQRAQVRKLVTSMTAEPTHEAMARSN